VSTTQIPGAGSMNPQSLEDDASGTVRVVQGHLPHFKPAFTLNLQHGWWSFELPYPPEAEYRFSLHGEIGGERQITAQLTQIATSRLGKRFWYSAMELADFRDDSSKLEELFYEQVKSVLHYPTRIVENKGVILLSYRAEYQSDGGWRRLRGGVSYLGLGLGIPVFGKERVYTSPPVESWAQG
jgi:hypothetical protein